YTVPTHSLSKKWSGNSGNKSRLGLAEEVFDWYPQKPSLRVVLESHMGGCPNLVSLLVSLAQSLVEQFPTDALEALVDVVPLRLESGHGLCLFGMEVDQFRGFINGPQPLRVGRDLPVEHLPILAALIEPVLVPSAVPGVFGRGVITVGVLKMTPLR